MAIFLGKNYLGQADEPVVRDNDNDLLQAMYEMEREIS